MADFIAAFERIGVASNRQPLFHSVRMSFPVADLQPKDTLPYLQPPRYVLFREKPRKDSYLLQHLGLDFDYRFRANTASQTAAAAVSQSRPGPYELVDLVDNLQHVAGSSELDITSFQDPSEDYAVRYIVKLRTVWRDGSRAKWLFRFSQGGLDLLQNFADDREWLTVLLELVEQKSDKAYLHVQRALEATWPELAASREADLDRQWDSKQPPSANELLMENLPHISGDGIFLLSELDCENLEYHANEKLAVWLPCGDRQFVTYRELMSLTEKECLELTCNNCGKRVWQKADSDALSMVQEKRIRPAFEQDSLHWTFHDAPARNPAMQLRVKTANLNDALIEALESLRAPVSAIPSALNPINFPEIGVVMASLRESLRPYGAEFTTTAQELEEGMEAEAVKAIGEYVDTDKSEVTRMSAPFWPFLGRWLTRTLNIVVKESTPAAKGTLDEVESLMRNAKMEED